MPRNGPPIRFSRAEWRTVFAELRPFRRGLALLALVSAAEVAARMLLPWPLKAIVDVLGAGAPLDPAVVRWLTPLLAVAGRLSRDPRIVTLVAIIAAGLLVQLAHQLVLLLHTRVQSALGLRMIRRMREQLFSHLQALSLAHYDRQSTGDAVHRLDADAVWLEALALRGWLPWGFSLLTLLAMLAILLRISVPLALASFAVVPLLLVWMRYGARRMAVRIRAAKQAESELLSQTFESFSAIRLVKSFARERYERRRFGRAAAAVMETRLTTARQDALFSVGVGVLTAVGTALVLGLGGLFVVRGRISPGTLLLAVTYLGFVYGPIVGIANTTSTIQHALASARRVREILVLPREDQEKPHAILPPALRGDVEFSRVSFGYPNGPMVLRDVSFTARPGQMVALVGPSGSGKSTLVGLIPRFRDPISGSVRIDGIDVREYRLAELRRQIAMVLQEAAILTGTIANNLLYGRLDATDREIREAAMLANADGFITALPAGYQTVITEAGRTLSGGQRQRLALARAFLRNAPLVILDEPTASLDPISERSLVEALERLRRDRTLIVIAHRLSTVRDADLTLVLQGGEVVARGTHDELMAGRRSTASSRAN